MHLAPLYTEHHEGQGPSMTSYVPMDHIPYEHPHWDAMMSNGGWGMALIMVRN